MDGFAGQPVAAGQGPRRPSGASSQLGRQRRRWGPRAKSLEGVSPAPDTGTASGAEVRISPRVAFIPALNSAPGRAVFPEGGATAAQLRGMGREKRAGGGRREWGRDFPQGFAGAAERAFPAAAAAEAQSRLK